MGFICAGVSNEGGYKRNARYELSVTNLLPLQQQQKTVSWQFSETYGVTSRGSGWKKSVVDQRFEFGDVNDLAYTSREWTENGQLWVQQVSSTPATRLDVVNLQEELDRRLQQRQARETGICPVRRELYSQCFGESFLFTWWSGHVTFYF